MRHRRLGQQANRVRRVPITNKADGSTVATGTVPLDSAGTATFTPATPLSAGAYGVVATFTSADGNYKNSTSRTLAEKVVAASAVGVGTISAGSSSSPVQLRGGQKLTVDVTQALNSTSNAVFVESGAGVTYVDSAQNIDLTDTHVTSVVFSPDGKRAEISGAGTNS